jgi:hypothetical protein
MISNVLTEKFLEIFGDIPPLLVFDEAMYDIDLSLILTSV